MLSKNNTGGKGPVCYMNMAVEMHMVTWDLHGHVAYKLEGEDVWVCAECLGFKVSYS